MTHKKPTTTKSTHDLSSLIEQEDRVAVGNKPKPKAQHKGHKLLTAKGQVVLIYIRPKHLANPLQTLAPPSKRDLAAIPIREQKSLSFAVKLDLPETSNPFYGTETHRQSFIREQLYYILSVLGITHHYHKQGDIYLTTFVETLETKGFDVELELKENVRQ